MYPLLFIVKRNGTQTVKVGEYDVVVVVNGNNKITDLYVAGFPNTPAPPAPTPPKDSKGNNNQQ